MSKRFCLLLLSLLTPLWANASQLSASGGCFVFNDHRTPVPYIDCGQTDYPYVPGSTLGGGIADGIAAANYSVRANYGSLAATVLAGTMPTATRAYANASSFVGFTDQVAVTSEVLRAGARITVELSLLVSAHASASDAVSGSAIMTGSAGISDKLGNYKRLAICSEGMDCAHPIPRTPAIYKLSFDATVGDTLELDLSMFNSAYSAVRDYPGADSPTRFSFSTAAADLYLSAPHVSFIGSTGHTYINPVPELSTYGMTLIGLIAMGLKLRRKNMARVQGGNIVGNTRLERAEIG